MKKAFKILVAIVIILTLLSGNIFSLAKATIESVTEQKNQANTIKNDSINNETTNTQQATQTEKQNNNEQQTSGGAVESETEVVDNTTETSEEKQQQNKKENENNKISLLNMNSNNTKRYCEYQSRIKKRKTIGRN